jgi:hypothetical protein
MASRTTLTPRAVARRVKRLAVCQYQLRIELKHVAPTIWRRILVPENVTLARLHPILLWAMGWQGGHLHEYVIARLHYGMPPEENEFGAEPVLDERRFRLNQFVESRMRRFQYIYDFGDYWEHTIVVEDIHPRKAGAPAVVCLGGENACPPEDVGGIPGYFEFLAAINNPAHEQHSELLQWIGGPFDPTAFNLLETNERLKEIRG